MAQSGYGLTLTGSSSGALVTKVQDVVVGGITVDFSEIKQPNDTNRVPENLPMTVRDGDMEVTLTFDETMYNTLRNAAIARTEETWTLTDAGSSYYAGVGFIAACGGRSLNTEAHEVFTLTLKPKTLWAFTVV